MKRAKLGGLLRNVAIAMGNSGDTFFLSRLEELAMHEDATVAEAASWAIRRLLANSLIHSADDDGP